MGGALQGFGTPTGYPTQTQPWGFTPQLTGQSGVTGLYGPQVPQQLQQLQAAVHHLLQTEFAQQQQIQQLLHIVPQQLQQIQQLVQFVAQQTSQSSPFHQTQPFPNVGYPMTSFGYPSGWLGSSPGTQPQLFGGQGGFGGQSGYVM
jgi:hypothetical protein